MVAHTTISADTPLDGSMRHRALTPKVRRLADEAWAIVRAKALAEGFPVEGAYLDVGDDMLEEHPQVIIVVDTAGTSKQVFAFWDEAEDDYQQWAEGLEAKSRKTALRGMRLFFNWTD